MENLELRITNIPPPQIIKANDTPHRDNSANNEAIRSEMEGHLSRYRMDINKLKEKIRTLEDVFLHIYYC